MTIEMKKIGNVLDSRPDGREAFLGMRPMFPRKQETIILDFQGMDVLTPSFADEFVSSLIQLFPGNVRFRNTENMSVKGTLAFLSEQWPSWVADSMKDEDNH